MTWPVWLYPWDSALDRWTGDDKLAHLFGASTVLLVLAPRIGLLGAWMALLGAIVAIEVWEAVHWERLSSHARELILGGRAPWPWMTDRASLKDIVAGLAGGLGATWLV